MASRNAKNQIVSALVSLMKRKPVEQISVKELAHVASVNRSTFYYHFSRVEDVLEYMMGLFLDNTRNLTTFRDGYVLCIGEGSEKAMAIADAFYGYVFQNHDLYRAIVGSTYKQRFYDDLVDIFVGQYRNYPHWWRPNGVVERMRSLERGYWDRSWAHLVIGMIEQWLIHDFEETPEELSGLTMRLFANVEGFELRLE